MRLSSTCQGMRLRRVDFIASGLASCTIVFGLLVLFLATLWFAQRTTSDSTPPGRILVRSGGGIPAVTKTAHEIMLPSETALESEPFSHELSKISIAASAIAVQLNAEASSASGMESKKFGLPPGNQDGVMHGSAADEIPRFERWEIVFQAANRQDYARQLDHFEIELGCIGGGVNSVDYCSALSSERITRKGPSSAEERLYFAWREGNSLATFDRELLQSAGIQTRGRLTLLFFPQELEQQLAALELQRAREAGKSDVLEIKKTLFRSTRSSEGYHFEIDRQIYRTTPN